MPELQGVGSPDSNLTPLTPLFSPQALSPPHPTLDRLGTFVASHSALLRNGLSFADLCRHHRGPSCLADPSGLPHPAVPLLRHLRRSGATALASTPPWSLADLDAAVARGPHLSAKLAAPFLRSEFADMVAAGHWLVVPYSQVRHLPGLRLSPTGVVPQRDRRDRTIVDYTFSHVNADTIDLAPDSLQFGHAFDRLLSQFHRADTRHGHIHLSKTDVADAFMRVWIHLRSITTLGALLPRFGSEPPLVAFPLVLPMGWINSPKYLCAVTETIADLTAACFLRSDLQLDPHRLDNHANTVPPHIPRPPPTSPPHLLPPPTIASRGPFSLP